MMRPDDWPPFAREAHRRLMVAAFGEQPRRSLLFKDAHGAPLSRGLVYIYEPGTDVPVVTYIDRQLTYPNTNPVVADSMGHVAICLVPNTTYDLVVCDAHGVMVGPRVRVHSS